MSAFLDTSAQLPYCPGCGHPHVLKALDQALTKAGLPPHRYALVTDIGCVGLADAYFPTLHTVHSLHGRAAAIATGIRLGEPRDPTSQDEMPLKPIVLVGDGGSTIGLLHLVHAAQVDADVTVLVHNNLIYGMTGGQHSGLTPEGFRTTTTPGGNLVPPLDLQQVLAGAGCGFYARTRAPGDDLVDVLTEAILHPGFACVEALELCPTFAARIGGMTGKGLQALFESDDRPTGITRRERHGLVASAAPVDRDPLAAGLEPQPEWNRLDRTARVVIAGRAGERIQSAAKLAASAGSAAGLQVTVRTDNPVTQGRGFSLAELTFSPERIDYTGLVDPDLVLVVAQEGLTELGRRGALEGKRVLLDSSLPADVPGAEFADQRKRYGGKAAALGTIVQTIHEQGWWALDAWRAAYERLPEALRADTEKTLAKAGVEVAPLAQP